MNIPAHFARLQRLTGRLTPSPTLPPTSLAASNAHSPDIFATIPISRSEETGFRTRARTSSRTSRTPSPSAFAIWTRS